MGLSAQRRREIRKWQPQELEWQDIVVKNVTMQLNE